MEQVTVIVPFYNVEAYFEECLDTLVNQTHSNVEILCIDDCSEDDSRAIAEAYASKDKRIKVLSHDVNKGLGGARNTGIQKAGGDYLCFVDSDDYVSERFVESMYTSIRSMDCDIGVCGINLDEGGSISPFPKLYKNEMFEISNNNVFEVAIQLNPACSNKIFKKDLILRNNILQPENRYYEDVLFWLKALYRSSKVCTISDRLYYYRQRSGSIMKSHSHKHIDDRLDFVSRIVDLVEDELSLAVNKDARKITNDALLFILEQLHVGSILIAEANALNREELETYYEEGISKMFVGTNWATLLKIYKYYLENKVLINSLRSTETSLKECQEHFAAASDRYRTLLEKKSSFWIKILISFAIGVVIINTILLLVFWA